MKIIKHNKQFSWLSLVKSFVYLLGEGKVNHLGWLSVVFLIQFYSIIPPLILGKIVDFFTNYSAGEPLSNFYFYAIFLGASFSIISFIRLSIKKHLGILRADISYNIRVKGFDRLLNLSLMDSRKEAAGEKAQRIQNGVLAFNTIHHELVSDIFSSITSVVGIFVVFLFLKPTFVIFLFIYVFGFVAIIRYFYNKIQQVNYELNKSLEKGEGAFIESLSNILTIKALGARQSFGSHIAKREDVVRKLKYLGRNYGVGQWIGFQVFNGICIASFLLLVGNDVVSGAITIGSIVIFYGYLNQLTSSASNMLGIYENIIQAKTAIARMMPIFWDDQKIVEGTKNFPISWDKIKFLQASFNYQDESKENNLTGLSDVNISIDKNMKIGIVGKTGSGKSTFAKIFLGLFSLDSGKYQIGSSNFYDLKHDHVTANISLVLQETEMFNLSLKDNVTMMRKIDPTLFEKAIEISQLKEVIDTLPNGVNTLIGEKGYHLSGGERQRLGIARAICKDPQILIFDEATSSLDNKTEDLIQVALEKQLTKKTLIYIAHRVSTLKNVDKIFVFDNGKIVEEGEYDNLLNDSKSKFSKLYRTQRETLI